MLKYWVIEAERLPQLTFVDDKGAPIALCIIRSDAREELALQMDVMQDMAAAKWAKGEFEYILIGHQDAESLQKIASNLVRNL